MNKWLNKQKPITLGFIMAILGSILVYVLSYFTEPVFEQISVLKMCGAIGCLMFFMSWGLFSMAESSLKVFKEIDDLQNRAKKIKTKTELTELIKEYNDLRQKSYNQGHYSQLNTIKGILETKKEFL